GRPMSAQAASILDIALRLGGKPPVRPHPCRASQAFAHMPAKFPRNVRHLGISPGIVQTQLPLLYFPPIDSGTIQVRPTPERRWPANYLWRLTPRTTQRQVSIFRRRTWLPPLARSSP